MKRSTLAHLLALSVVLALGTTGCKHPQKGVTPIQKPAAAAAPRQPGPVPPVTNPNVGQGGVVTPGPGTTDTTKSTDVKPLETPSGFTQGDIGDLEGMKPDTNYFKAQTVHFDFDSSVVKTTEHDKADFVGDELKKKPETKLMIDGHCDERGTEEYNRALGERRALALREYLIRYGIAPERVFTRSFGEDQPANPAHNDEAWKENRRGEFILLLPK